MADKSTALVLSALSRAAADGGGCGVPLYGSKAAPGLFPGTQAGRQAAQRCQDEGYLSPLEGPSGNGRAAVCCAITDKGLAYLLGQVSPRQVLEDFVRALEAREAQVAQLVGAARQMQAGLEALRATVASVLARVSSSPSGDLKTLFQEFRRRQEEKGEADPAGAILAALASWPAGAAEDCPLPELYRQLEARGGGGGAGLSVGAFHDALRRLHQAGRVYLHPWTGPMYEIPRPGFALLVGHEIAYYASLRPAAETLQIAN